MSRALIKQAIEERDWDLLDKLLDNDNSHVNDAKLFTDDWGEWWAPLYECCLGDQVEGVRVLLKHGAKRKQRAWGDGMCSSPLELAEEKGYHEQDEHYGAEREDVEIRRFGEGFKGGEEIEGIVAVNVTAGRSRVHVEMLKRSPAFKRREASFFRSHFIKKYPSFCFF